MSHLRDLQHCCLFTPLSSQHAMLINACQNRTKGTNGNRASLLERMHNMRRNTQGRNPCQPSHAVHVLPLHKATLNLRAPGGNHTAWHPRRTRLKASTDIGTCIRDTRGTRYRCVRSVLWIHPRACDFVSLEFASSRRDPPLRW